MKIIKQHKNEKKKSMFSASPISFRHKNFKARLKTRMVGYIPKFVARKAKNSMVSLRSEANTGAAVGYLKSEPERLDNTGKKLTRVRYDELLRRYTLFKEAKIKQPLMLKSHIQKPAPLPWLKAEGKGGKI